MQALEKATRGALALANLVIAGCGTGTITIVSPTNGGFSDPSGNVTAQVSIGGGANWDNVFVKPPSLVVAPLSMSPGPARSSP